MAEPLPWFFWLMTSRLWPSPPRVEQRRRPVGRPVVDDDDLKVEPERLDTLEHLADRRLLVVGGDDEGDAHPGKPRTRGGG